MKRLLVPGVLLFFGLNFVIGGAYWLWEQGQYAREGRTVQATVLQVEFTSTGRNKNNPKSVRVTYEFHTEDGRIIQGHDLVRPETGRRLTEGGPVEIQYFPTSPHFNQIHESGEESTYALWIGIGIAFLLPVPLVWWLSGKTPARAQPAASAP